MLETAAINPPKPIACVVMEGNIAIAKLTIESVKDVAKRIEELEAKREEKK